MSEISIRVRPNGPLLVEGSVQLFDSQGNPYPINPDKPSIALCRCGASARRPFCDGAHKTSGFACDGIVPRE
jgi:CDGSH-type Zn-finger protein